MRVLVKVRGRKKNQAAIHVYNEATDSALCQSWLKPGDEWEVQEVAIAGHCENLCWHCENKRRPKPEKLPAPGTLREQRQAKDLRKLAAWNAQVI